MRIVGPETRQCPPEFQERLTRMFGRNEFGDPHFKIVWGQSAFHRIGNVWRDRKGNERRGYRYRYMAHGMACWVIMRWKSPKIYGTPDLWYQRTYDEKTRLHFMGEYPWRGRYEVMQPLINKEFKDGELKITHFPLSHVLIDKLIPLMLQWQQLSEEERRAADKVAREIEERKITEEITDRMMDSLPMTYGPISYSHQGCRTSLIDKKMEAIQRQWNRLSVNGRRPIFHKGFQMGKVPRIRTHVN